jgi:hypothetical protein
MGLSTAQSNYYFGSGRNEGITGPQPGSGNGMNKPQPVQGTRPVDSVRTYEGYAPKSYNEATTMDYPRGNAMPPRGEFHSRTPFWKGTQYVPPKEEGRLSGIPDPPTDGPQRPSLHQLLQNWSMWQGTDKRSYDDDLTRSYAKVTGNKNMPVIPIGQQDGTYTRIAGGEVGYHRNYTRAPNDAGPGNDPISVQDVSHKHPAAEYVYGGPPHGLHTQTVPSGVQPLKTRLASPQMKPVRQDRLSNSHYSGASYSQRTAHQGASPTKSSGGGKFRKSRMGT